MNDRELILVTGSPRSGTSTMAGTLTKLGYHMPEPLIPPNEINRHGMYETRRIVDWHKRVLASNDVTMTSGMPTHPMNVPLPLVRILLKMISDIKQDRVVIKDARAMWAIPTWEAVTHEAGFGFKLVVMYRHPFAVVNSIMRYKPDATPVTELAGWLNTNLSCEASSRSFDRHYVNYSDLLYNAEERLKPIVGSRPSDLSFIRPDMRHNTDDVPEGIPPWMYIMAEDIYRQLDTADRRVSQDILDMIRATYVNRYNESMELVQATIAAAKRSAVRCSMAEEW